MIQWGNHRDFMGIKEMLFARGYESNIPIGISGKEL